MEEILSRQENIKQEIGDLKFSLRQILELLTKSGSNSVAQALYPPLPLHDKDEFLKIEEAIKDATAYKFLV